MKTSRSFRLSDQALSNLASVVKKSGANETAIIELALAAFADAYKPDPSFVPGQYSEDFLGLRDTEIFSTSAKSLITKPGRKRH